MMMAHQPPCWRNSNLYGLRALGERDPRGERFLPAAVQDSPPSGLAARTYAQHRLREFPATLRFMLPGAALDAPCLRQHRYSAVCGAGSPYGLLPSAAGNSPPFTAVCDRQPGQMAQSIASR